MANEIPPIWNFSRVQIQDQQTRTLPLTSEQKKLINDYQEVLRVASESKVARPTFSQYYVREAIGPVGKQKYPAGNIEYGYMQGLHGEESAMSTLRLMYPDYQGPVILGILTDGIAAPCGNCRDLMRDVIHPPTDLHIVSGCPDGGDATACNLNDFLFEDFAELHEQSLLEPITQMAQYTHHRAELLEYDPYRPSNFPHPQRVYRAGILTTEGVLYPGAYRTDAAYHPTYPLENATHQAADDYSIASVIIVTQNFLDQPPDVLYRDRQALYEHNQKQEDITGNDIDPPVYLVNNRLHEQPQVWRTTIKQWLPLPFSADNFGPFRDQIRQYNQRYQR